MEAIDKCLTYAKMIGGYGYLYNGTCVLVRPRRIKPYILGIRTRSLLASAFTLTVESTKTTSLNLGEAFVLKHEVKPFMNALKRRGLIVTDAKTKWAYDYPQALYVHWETLGDQTEFIKKSIAAAKEAGLY